MAPSNVAVTLLQSLTAEWWVELEADFRLNTFLRSTMTASFEHQINMLMLNNI